MGKGILAICDDLDFFNGIRERLAETVDMQRAGTVEEALRKIQLDVYSMIILYVSKDIGCKDIVAMLRDKNPVPVLVLLENPSISEKVSALQNGADCVLEGAVDEDILLAQIDALLRRYTELNHIAQNEKAVICCGRLLVDVSRRAVFLGEERIEMPNKEYEILLYMLKNRWRVLTHKQIYETVWNDKYLEDKSVIFYHIGELRRRLGKGWIENVHGVGYRLGNQCTKPEKP